MSRLQTLFECVGRAVRAAGGPPAEPAPLDEELLELVRAAHHQMVPRLPGSDLRAALREAVAAPLETVELALRDAVYDVAGDRPAEEREALASFLELLAPSLRQSLRRPGDPAGTSVPDYLPVDEPEDWLAYFPDRPARFRAGETLEVFDNWQAVEQRGFGPHGETWRGWSGQEGESATAALKFVSDPRAAADFPRHEEHFRRVLELDPAVGLVQLRSVYLLTDPPCLEYAFVSGYDATGLMRDWLWRGVRSKPDQASLIVRRVARVVGHLHQLNPPMVHRGLKPANVLLHPTAGGKVTVYVADVGWGEIASALALQAPRGEVQERRQARRGAYAPLYASPQQKAGEPPDPRDDVYAIGVIWYQLLVRDPTAPPPVGTEWALEFRDRGLSDGHARLLASCLEEDPAYRPANGMVLAAQIDANFTRPPESGSGSFQLKGTSSSVKPIIAAAGVTKRAPRGALPEKLADTVVNSVGMEFALVPPGEFVMGSPPNEKGRHDWEGPARRVRINRPFYLGVTPVTQAQYQQVMGRNPSHFSRALGGGPDHPVEQVSWADAVAFCRRLMDLPGEAANLRAYRLPTEAEWEYACRAGTDTAYAFGDEVNLEEVHYFGLSPAALVRAAGTAGKTAKVGGRAANDWGLYDMHGNVLEWCQDWWDEDYYESAPPVDPPGPRAGEQRVARGGSFSQFAADCRSAARLGRNPAGRLNTVGFRVVMVLPEM
jgi:formylglycine-generating enzyme required for sulfatase activity